MQKGLFIFCIKKKPSIISYETHPYQKAPNVMKSCLIFVFSRLKLCNEPYFGHAMDTVNKGQAIFRPQSECHLSNSPWPGIIDPIPVPGRFGQNKSRNLVIFVYSVYPQKWREKV